MLGLAAAAVVAAVAGTPTLASATNYAIARTYLTSGSFNGAQGTWSVQSNTVPDCGSGGHINQTEWLWTNGGTTNWVEAGWTHCFHANQTGDTGYYYYWGDNRPNYGYQDGMVAGASGTSDTYIIKHTATSFWSIYYDGNNLASSSPNPGPSITIDQGLESTSTGHQNTVGVTNLQWLDTSNNWHSWGSGSNAYVLAQQAGYYYNQGCSGACANDGGN